MSQRSIYAYCLVSGRRAPALRGVPAGVPGGDPPRAIEVAPGLRLIASDVPAHAYSEEAIARGLSDLDWVGARAVPHDEVVSHFLGAPALLPLKAFTIFRDEPRALAHVRAREAEVRAALARLEGCVELGVRLRFDAERAKRALGARAAESRGASSGADFLARKKGLRDAATRARDEALAAAGEAARALAAEARAHVTIPLPEGAAGGSLLLDVALLVSRDARERVEARARALAAELERAGVSLERTGPWAPYHFVAVEP